MPHSLSGRHIGRAFEAPFADPLASRKLAIGSGLVLLGYLIPILPSLLFYGYLVRLMRSVLRSGETALPEWGDWGQAMWDGLRLWAVGFVYRLPAYLLFALALLSMAEIPFAIQVWAEQGPETSPFWIALPYVELAGLGAGMLASALVGALIGIVLPAIVAHVVAHNDVAAAFRPGEWWPIDAARPSTYLIVFVLMGACSLALSMLAQVLSASLLRCCLVPLVVSPLRAYLRMVSSILFAFAYRSASPASGHTALDRIH
jgi:hypothetical protein